MIPDNAGGLIYGTILVATLLAAESARRDTYADTVAAVALTLLMYWLTISYAHYTGERIEREEPFHHRGFGRVARHEVTLLYGCALPLLVILIGWAIGLALGTSVNIAVGASAALIVVTEIVLGVRAELERAEVVRQTALGALLGLAVVGLRLLLH